MEGAKMTDFKILEENRHYRTHQFLIDEVEHLQLLPAEEIGSVALVASTSDVYILNNKKEWVKL